MLKQVKENGITIFLSKITNSYTKYFNTKYKRIGPLFQGTFKAVRVQDDEQLIHTSRYIHLNPLTQYLVKNLRDYQFSSYLEYVEDKPGFCKKDQILLIFPLRNHMLNFTLDQEDYGRAIKTMKQVWA